MYICTFDIGHSSLTHCCLDACLAHLKVAANVHDHNCPS